MYHEKLFRNYSDFENRWSKLTYGYNHLFLISSVSNEFSSSLIRGLCALSQTGHLNFGVLVWFCLVVCFLLPVCDYNFLVKFFFISHWFEPGLHLLAFLAVVKTLGTEMIRSRKPSRKINKQSRFKEILTRKSSGPFICILGGFPVLNVLDCIIPIPGKAKENTDWEIVGFYIFIFLL